MAKMHVYGIPNCDITKKALRWLEDHKLDFVFHDHKKEPPQLSKLNHWCDQAGWERVLNKKSTTWRSLAQKEQAAVTNRETAIRTMMANNSIIKRPVIESGKKIFIGFNEVSFSKSFFNQ